MSGYLKKIKIFKEFVGKETWRGLKFSLLGGLLLFVSESFMAFSIPLFLLNLELVSYEKIPFFLQSFPRSLFLSVVFILFCVLLRSVTLVVYQYTSEYVKYSFIAAARKRLVGIGIAQRSAVSSRTILYFMNEVSLPSSMALRSLSEGLSFLVGAVALVVLSFVYATWESCIALALLILAIIPLRYFDKKIERRGEEMAVHSKKLTKSLTDGFRNFFLLKLYGRLDEIVKNMRLSIARYDQTHKSYSFVCSVKANIYLVMGSTILCTTTLLSHHYFNTHGVRLVAFFYLFVRVVQYCSNITFNFSDGLFHLPKLKEMHDWIEGQKKVACSSGEPLPLSEGKRQNLGRFFLNRELLLREWVFRLLTPEAKHCLRILILVFQGGIHCS